MTTRSAHFVGSLPKELTTSDVEQMSWFLTRSRKTPLTGLPCDLDPDWIIDYLRGRSAYSDVFHRLSSGDYEDYNSMPSYGVLPGRTVEPRHVAMGRRERIDKVVKAFTALQSDHPELNSVKVQISQPHPLDMALFVFAGAAVSDGLGLRRALRHGDVVVSALRHLPVFTQAVLSEIEEVVADHGDRVIWHVETPVTLLGMVKAAQLHGQGVFTPLLARQLGSFLARVHGIGATTTLHLCYGDYRHKALLSPRSLQPAVRLLNATARILDGMNVPLPPAHIPCGFGAEPAPEDRNFYKPLRKLDPNWKVIAGVVSPGGLEATHHSLALFEEELGRTAFGVATACGFGRLSIERADDAAVTTVAAAHAPVVA